MLLDAEHKKLDKTAVRKLTDESKEPRDIAYPPHFTSTDLFSFHLLDLTSTAQFTPILRRAAG